LADTYQFHPSLTISRPPDGWHLPPTHPFVHRAVFLVGVMELISYWKAACPPRIIVNESLDSWETSWWASLVQLGMAEFLYRNGLPTQDPDLVTFEGASGQRVSPHNLPRLNGSLIPIGGGKDSALLLSLLRSDHANTTCLLLNPTPAATTVVQTAGYSDRCAIVTRKVDPLLFQLNNEGFLNGHTPFSALLAFVSVLAAGLWGIEHVILANESSANESTILGTTINHQYSKTITFENAFRQYVETRLSPDINYFSGLRHLNEVQIAERFASRGNDLLDVFCSCNVRGREGYWCNRCDKCLFAYLMLAPFVPKERLSVVFGEDLLLRLDLLAVLERLAGIGNVKPFECVGTVDEVRAAVLELYPSNAPLITALIERHPQLLHEAVTLGTLRAATNTHHNIPAQFTAPLR
jgi:UDP-N-acetyl-alpha-D-muramoyl-L-alanyl-L-glutamate epimerase